MRRDLVYLILRIAGTLLEWSGKGAGKLRENAKSIIYSSEELSFAIIRLVS